MSLGSTLYSFVGANKFTHYCQERAQQFNNFHPCTANKSGGQVDTVSSDTVSETGLGHRAYDVICCITMSSSSTMLWCAVAKGTFMKMSSKLERG